MSATFTYRNRTITLQPNGEFECDGLYAPSLLSMKRQINKHFPFVPFDAYVIEFDKLREVRIVDVRRPHHSAKPVFVGSDGATYPFVYDGDVEAYVAECKRIDREIENLTALKNAATMKLPKRKPEV